MERKIGWQFHLVHMDFLDLVCHVKNVKFDFQSVKIELYECRNENCKKVPCIIFPF